jgi:hypothetical protein
MSIRNCLHRFRKSLTGNNKQLLKRIDHIAVDWDYYRKEAIEKLLEIAVAKVDEEGAETFLK